MQLGIVPPFFLLGGHLPVMGVYQSFRDSPTSAWCFLPDELSFLAMRLDKRPVVGSSHTLATLYRWQGVFVQLEVGQQLHCPLTCTWCPCSKKIMLNNNTLEYNPVRTVLAVSPNKKSIHSKLYKNISVFCRFSLLGFRTQTLVLGLQRMVLPT